MLDDEELVGPLQQLVDRRAHRALDDSHQLLGVHGRLASDEERSAPALVVGGERDELQDPLDVELVEARLAEPLGRVLAHEPLRARAGVDPGRLDPDDPPRPLGGGRRQADQRDHLLRRQPRHRRFPLERIPRDDSHLGPQRALAAHDVRGDVLGQALDQQRLADHHLLDRLREELREARHVHALLARVEIDGAVDVRRDQLLAAAVADPDRFLHAADASAREPEGHLGRRGLEVVC